jgi:hypothetical protein
LFLENTFQSQNSQETLREILTFYRNFTHELAFFSESTRLKPQIDTIQQMILDLQGKTQNLMNLVNENPLEQFLELAPGFL